MITHKDVWIWVVIDNHNPSHLSNNLPNSHYFAKYKYKLPGFSKTTSQHNPDFHTLCGPGFDVVRYSAAIGHAQSNCALTRPSNQTTCLPNRHTIYSTSTSFSPFIFIQVKRPNFQLLRFWFIFVIITDKSPIFRPPVTDCLLITGQLFFILSLWIFIIGAS